MVKNDEYMAAEMKKIVYLPGLTEIRFYYDNT